MRSRNQIRDGSGNGPQSDLLKQLNDRLDELQFFDTATITVEQTTRGTRFHVKRANNAGGTASGNMRWRGQWADNTLTPPQIPADGLGQYMTDDVVFVLGEGTFVSRVDNNTSKPTDQTKWYILPALTLYTGAGVPSATTLTLTGPVDYHGTDKFVMPLMPDLYFDTTNFGFYVCITTGSNATSVWKIVNYGPGLSFNPASGVIAQYKTDLSITDPVIVLDPASCFGSDLHYHPVQYREIKIGVQQPDGSCKQRSMIVCGSNPYQAPDDPN